MPQHFPAQHLQSDQIALIFEGVQFQFLDFVCLFDAEYSNGYLWNRSTIVQVSMTWCIVVIQICHCACHLASPSY